MQERSNSVATTPPTRESSTATTYDPYAGRRATSNRLVQAVYLVFGLIEVLLLVRFVLRALGANAEAGFAQLVYAVTGVLVAPFIGLFGTPQVASGQAFELTTLIALLVYAGVGWLLARATWLIFGEGRSASVASVTSHTERSRSA